MAELSKCFAEMGPEALTSKGPADAIKRRRTFIIKKVMRSSGSWVLAMTTHWTVCFDTAGSLSFQVQDNHNLLQLLCIFVWGSLNPNWTLRAAVLFHVRQ